MKIFALVLRILLGLFLLMPVVGALGVLPEPTADMYSPAGWAFMSALMETGYMMPLVTITSLICAILFFWGKEALAAVLLAPFTVNVIAFHLFLDPNPFAATTIPAWILLLLNLFFLWRNREKYKMLWA